MKKGDPKSWILWITLVTAALALIVFLGPFWEVWYYICSHCARRRDTSSRTLFWTPITIWSRHEDSDTPLSTLLTSEGLNPPHEHRWFPGEGRGYKMSGSGGGWVMRIDAESPRVVALVRHLLRKGERDAAFKWIGVAVSARALPKDALDVYLRAENFPDDPSTVDGWVVDGLRRVESRFPKYLRLTP